MRLGYVNHFLMSLALSRSTAIKFGFIIRQWLNSYNPGAGSLFPLTYSSFHVEAAPLKTSCELHACGRFELQIACSEKHHWNL